MQYMIFGPDDRARLAALRERLQTALPEVLHRAIGFHDDPPDSPEAGGDAVVALALLERPTHAERLAAALEGYDDYQLLSEGTAVAAPATTVALPAAPTAAAAQWFDQSADTARRLTAILTTAAYDADWPEDHYEGAEQRCYASIVQQLGRVPKDDKGIYLKPGALAGVTKPADLPDTAWTAVFGHIRDELLFFAYVWDWYGHDGYLQWFQERAALNNFLDLRMLNDRYLKVSTDAVLRLVFSTIYSLMAKAVSYSGLPGASAAVTAFWAVASSGAGAVKSQVETSIGEAQQAIRTSLAAATDKIEGSARTLNTNWGRLSAFARMLLDGELAWPESTAPLLMAATVAYHTYVFELILPKSEWYVCELTLHARQGEARRWNPDRKDYVLHTSAREYRSGLCHGWARREYFLGKPNLTPPANRYPVMAPASLHGKLFGLDRTTDPTDPQLSWQPGYYLQRPNGMKLWPYSEICQVS